MPEVSQEILEECAYMYVEDLVHECIHSSDEPVRTNVIVLWLRERGLSVSSSFIRAFFLGSERFVSDGRRWEVACRKEAEGAAIDGAARALLRGVGRPLPLRALAHQVALAKTMGPKETMVQVERLVRSRDSYFVTEEGMVGLSEWLLRVGSGSHEDVVLDNFFEDSSEVDAISEAFDQIRRDDDSATMLAAMEVVGCPLTIRALQYLCWRRDPAAFDAQAHYVALLRSDDFLVFSDQSAAPSSLRPPIIELIQAAAQEAAEEDGAAHEGLTGGSEFRLSDEDMGEVIALLEQKRRSMSPDALVMEALEVFPEEERFAAAVARLEDALEGDDRLIKIGGRYTLPECVPQGLNHIPPMLVLDRLNVVGASGEDVDVELDDPGLDGDLAERVHDPEREDVGEEDEVLLDPAAVATPEAVTWVVPYHHFLAGTLKIRKMDGDFYGGQTGVVDCVFRYAQSGEVFVTWANLDNGLLFGLGDFYRRYLRPSGSVLRIRPLPAAGEFELYHDGETDPLTWLDDESMKRLLDLRTECEARRMSVLDVMSSLMPFHEEGAPFLRIHTEVNACRRTSKRVVASMLSYYQCFHQRSAQRDRWVFDDRKVEQGRSRSKRKYVRKGTK
ncbi:MAG TPA: hypothetical protein PLD23_13470 [Armatimonadota bacterium]|nr:hypothetical protein [Armatimonadota bacterium]